MYRHIFFASLTKLINEHFCFSFLENKNKMRQLEKDSRTFLFIFLRKQKQNAINSAFNFF